ncbi:alpha-ketoglutarate-dependent dioxygenase alkB homolog 7, mitochondrial-like isoform X2 [Hydractinia symbiolongicarpus]|uniref:alpha-ketoglutarate-dependent dioxygenase alkB homolog 7, mitochondrial-like isoform X2 n=1 Tax=Hydractinia symbiolongicarpus TaxID=13093 RepID=UPI00254B4B6D|nr:alpha-ketoglutarate-dependent dioxygenase alkB homolog 7, mitochondrial-like isoform X2 [Hydractinia symbiolongicarpus]
MKACYMLKQPRSILRNYEICCHVLKRSLKSYSEQHAIVKARTLADNNAVKNVKRLLDTDLILYLNYITRSEQDELMKEIDKLFRRKKYEYDHWDGAITGFRETEKTRWNAQNQAVLNRIRSTCFGDDEKMIPGVHVLDLAKNGSIHPHTDSVKFCGTTIAGLSLLSSAVMRYTSTKYEDLTVDVLLPEFSVYVMKNTFRYDFKHELLGEDDSKWNNQVVPRNRRVSVLMRNDS